MSKCGSCKTEGVDDSKLALLRRSQEVSLACLSANKGVHVAVIRDYLQLTKPRIMVLLLVSTVCPMILAGSGSLPSAYLLICCLLGGALVSGSASAFNCIIDRDIDRLMERTKSRPLAEGRISVIGATVFASLLLLFGTVVFLFAVNTASCLFALLGHFIYVVIYSLGLKRTTPQNIVIGGAAGAIPPLVGWTAVTGDVSAAGLLISLVIFLWTPPHFWALAFVRCEDYRKAGVPMMPVVVGAERTFDVMVYYGLLLAAASLALIFSDASLGWLYSIGMFGLNLIFLKRLFKLKASAEKDRTKSAWGVFGFSIVYLAAFFVLIVVDSVAR